MATSMTTASVTQPAAAQKAAARPATDNSFVSVLTQLTLNRRRQRATAKRPM